ncbi:hypothetical protein F5X99DRAFT_431339 [Biscogniauxia marginata]|nr:hypothetical protein F5X99DRAFT_431339 [Biscogniauxia marginata]
MSQKPITFVSAPETTNSIPSMNVQKAGSGEAAGRVSVKSSNSHEPDLVSKSEKDIENQSTQKVDPTFPKQRRSESFPKAQAIGELAKLFHAEEQRGHRVHKTGAFDGCAVNDEESGRENSYHDAVRYPDSRGESRVVECSPEQYEKTADPGLPPKLGDVVYRPETVYKSRSYKDNPEVLYWFIWENCSHF